VVGRTGAGKSSLVSVLFRLIDPLDGQVRIDGMDTKTLGLEALRSRISIIPQEPVLMMGTVRFNLDPFNEHPDAWLAEAIQRVGLDVRLSINDAVDVGGANMSAGERQLLCFARALILKENRILVMDEPSSSLDMGTDRIMVDLINDEFRRKRQCTVLTVAHRLETIIGADRIMVMRDGRVLEFDNPRSLLRREGSEFGSMVAALGRQASSRLMGIADSAPPNDA
jgi:ABC-type multidrug transport system fused ATPase/permease subunit